MIARLMPRVVASLVAGGIWLCSAPARTATAPADCQATLMREAGRATYAQARCYQKAYRAGLPAPDPLCLSQAQRKLHAAVWPCSPTGDGLPPAVDACVGYYAAGGLPTTTTSTSTTTAPPDTCPPVPTTTTTTLCTPSPEVCDGLDNDCDGIVDDNGAHTSLGCTTGVCDSALPGCVTCPAACAQAITTYAAAANQINVPTPPVCSYDIFREAGSIHLFALSSGGGSNDMTMAAQLCIINLDGTTLNHQIISAAEQAACAPAAAAAAVAVSHQPCVITPP